METRRGVAHRLLWVCGGITKTGAPRGRVVPLGRYGSPQEAAAELERRERRGRFAALEHGAGRVVLIRDDGRLVWPQGRRSTVSARKNLKLWYPDDEGPPSPGDQQQYAAYLMKEMERVSPHVIDAYRKQLVAEASAEAVAEIEARGRGKLLAELAAKAPAPRPSRWARLGHLFWRLMGLEN